MCGEWLEEGQYWVDVLCVSCRGSGSLCRIWHRSEEDEQDVRSVCEHQWSYQFGPWIPVSLAIVIRHGGLHAM